MNKRKATLRRVIRSAQRDTGGGLFPTIVRAFSVAVGCVVLELPLPNPRASIAFSIGLAAAGHTALRVASRSSSWSGDLSVLKEIDRLTDDTCGTVLAMAFEDIEPKCQQVAREFFVRPAAFLPLRADNLSWCEPPDLDAPAFGDEMAIESFERSELKNVDVEILQEVMPVLARGLKPGPNALIEYICSANAIGKIALSRWSRADARLLNCLAILTSRQECPNAETRGE